MPQHPICHLILQQFNFRIFNESIPRIIKVLDMLTHEEVWLAPNKNSNSIGHLILHLCGNVTQWIGAGIGSRSDTRNRRDEFMTSDHISIPSLISQLLDLRIITDTALTSLDDATLQEIRVVQGFEESVLGIIIHVIEHFSYHTGQIALICKYLKDTDLGFYEGLDLNITS